MVTGQALFCFSQAMSWVREKALQVRSLGCNRCHRLRQLRIVRQLEQHQQIGRMPSGNDLHSPFGRVGCAQVSLLYVSIASRADRRDVTHRELSVSNRLGFVPDFFFVELECLPLTFASASQHRQLEHVRTGF